MLGQKVQDALNAQLNKEFYSAYLYLGMSAYFDSKDLPGFANFMKVQWQEEMSHAMRIFNYITEVGGKVELNQINKPTESWEDVTAVFEAVYEHECYITQSINDVLSISHEEKDYATINMLQWFIGEQVEEEASMLKILNQLKMIGGQGAGIFMLDRELGARVTTVDLNNPQNAQ
jgi:ferritin